jgi:hypothetical protein
MATSWILGSKVRCDPSGKLRPITPILPIGYCWDTWASLTSAITHARTPARNPQWLPPGELTAERQTQRRSHVGRWANAVRGMTRCAPCHPSLVGNQTRATAADIDKVSRVRTSEDRANSMTLRHVVPMSRTSAACLASNVLSSEARTPHACPPLILSKGEADRRHPVAVMPSPAR